MRANVILMLENETCGEDIKNMLNDLGITNINFDEIRNIFHGSQENHSVKKTKLQIHSPNFRTDKKTFEQNYSVNSCWFGKFAISPEGKIIPCIFERNIIYGDVRQNKIIDILERSSELKRYWYFSHKNISPCSLCEYRLACKDCRPISYAIRGVITDKNPRCFYDPLIGAWK